MSAAAASGPLDLLAGREGCAVAGVANCVGATLTAMTVSEQALTLTARNTYSPGLVGDQGLFLV